MRRRTAFVASLAAAALSLASACSGTSSPSHPSSRATKAGGAVQPEFGGTIALSTAIPRIEKFVASERGLAFKRNVKVTLLSPKKFVAKLRSSQGKDDAKEIEKTHSTLAALGLIPVSTDLGKAFHSALDAGVIGFYDAKSRQLYVRGTRATPGVQAVLAHELTHALTDQWFGINRPAIDKDTQEKSLAFTTLIEGDAERTRLAYEAKMSASDKAAAEKEEASGGVPKVPQIVLELIGLPYAIGPQFVDSLISHGGLAELNKAYRHPPVSSEQVLDVTHYLDGDAPKHVATPRADGTPLDKSDLGQLGLFLTLSQQLGQSEAVTASRGWGGDEYVSWKSGSRYCLRDSIVMDDSDATARLHTALAMWAAKSNGRMHVESSSATTTFLSCSS